MAPLPMRLNTVSFGIALDIWRDDALPLSIDFFRLKVSEVNLQEDQFIYLL